MVKGKSSKSSGKLLLKVCFGDLRTCSKASLRSSHLCGLRGLVIFRTRWGSRSSQLLALSTKLRTVDDWELNGWTKRIFFFAKNGMDETLNCKNVDYKKFFTSFTMESRPSWVKTSLNCWSTMGMKHTYMTQAENATQPSPWTFILILFRTISPFVLNVFLQTTSGRSGWRARSPSCTSRVVCWAASTLWTWCPRSSTAASFHMVKASHRSSSCAATRWSLKYQFRFAGSTRYVSCAGRELTSWLGTWDQRLCACGIFNSSVVWSSCEFADQLDRDIHDAAKKNLQQV